MEQTIPLILLGLLIFGSFFAISSLSGSYSLNHIKSRRVGNGQHGTARFATAVEIKRTYAHVPYTPSLWRQGRHLPSEQGIILGSRFRGKKR